MRHDVHLRPVDGQVLGHHVGVVAVERRERRHLRRPFAEQIASLGVVRLGEFFEEDVLAREGANHRRAAPLVDASRHAEQHRVRQMDDVGPHLVDQPVD
ncbi:MAG: hypothetical protein AAF596_09535, partial [Planctomycetota bacterium]